MRKKELQPRNMASVTGTRRGARSSAGGGRRISGRGRRCSIWRSGGGAFGTGRRSTAPAFEVGGVPTRPLQLKTGRRQLLGQCRGLALRTIGHRALGELLQEVETPVASAATVSINRHGAPLNIKGTDYTAVSYGRPRMFGTMRINQARACPRNAAGAVTSRERR